jgi:hypothetical protein
VTTWKLTGGMKARRPCRPAEACHANPAGSPFARCGMPRPVPVIHLNSDTLCSSKIVAVSEPAPAERVVQYLIHDRLTFLLPQGSLGITNHAATPSARVSSTDICSKPTLAPSGFSLHIGPTQHRPITSPPPCAGRVQTDPYPSVTRHRSRERSNRQRAAVRCGAGSAGWPHGPAYFRVTMM